MNMMMKLGLVSMMVALGAGCAAGGEPSTEERTGATQEALPIARDVSGPGWGCVAWESGGGYCWCSGGASCTSMMNACRQGGPVIRYTPGGTSCEYSDGSGVIDGKQY